MSINDVVVLKRSVAMIDVDVPVDVKPVVALSNSVDPPIEVAVGMCVVVNGAVVGLSVVVIAVFGFSVVVSTVVGFSVVLNVLVVVGPGVVVKESGVIVIVVGILDSVTP